MRKILRGKLCKFFLPRLCSDRTTTEVEIAKVSGKTLLLLDFPPPEGALARKKNFNL